MTDPADRDSPEGRRPLKSLAALDDLPGCTVVVCDGTACSRAQPVPGEVLRRLGTAVALTTGGVLVRALHCLGPCGHAPVVTLTRRHGRPPDDAPPTTGQPTWAGITVWASLAQAGHLDHTHTWIRAGGPGAAPLPGDLDTAIIAIQ